MSKRSSWPGGVDEAENARRLTAHLDETHKGNQALAAKYPELVAEPVGATRVYRLLAELDFHVTSMALRGRPTDGLPTPTPEDMVAALRQVSAAKADANRVEWSLIAMAVRRGISWRLIAEALRLGTPQAARQRFERLSAAQWEPPLSEQRLADISELRRKP